MHACMQTCMYTYIDTRTQTHTHKCACVRVCMRVSVCAIACAEGGGTRGENRAGPCRPNGEHLATDPVLVLMEAGRGALARHPRVNVQCAARRRIARARLPALLALPRRTARPRHLLHYAVHMGPLQRLRGRAAVLQGRWWRCEPGNGRRAQIRRGVVQDALAPRLPSRLRLWRVWTQQAARAARRTRGRVNTRPARQPRHPAHARSARGAKCQHRQPSPHAPVRFVARPLRRGAHRGRRNVEAQPAPPLTPVPAEGRDHAAAPAHVRPGARAVRRGKAHVPRRRLRPAGPSSGAPRAHAPTCAGPAPAARGREWQRRAAGAELLQARSQPLAARVLRLPDLLLHRRRGRGGHHRRCPRSRPEAWWREVQISKISSWESHEPSIFSTDFTYRKRTARQRGHRRDIEGGGSDREFLGC